MFKATILGVLLSSAAVAAEGWGSLKGSFQYDGTPPKPAPITVDKDTECCAKHGLVDEGVMVDPKTKAIQNVVVYLHQSRTDKTPPIHPDLLAAAKEKVKINNANCRFDPHIIPAFTGQTVILGNSNPVSLNPKVNSLSPENPPIDRLIPAKTDIEHFFKGRENLPTEVSCSIHPWMKGYIVVKDHPYIAITGADGSFEIKNLPAGKWTFQIWQEKSGFVDKVKVNGKDPKWAKGRVDVTIEPDKTADLGEVMVAPANFKK
jgi:hypothetical protein